MLCVSALPVARAAELDLVGNVGWDRFGTRLRIRSERIENNRDRGLSGTLRLQIIATTDVFDGTQTNVYVVGTLRLGQLDAGFSFADVSRLVGFHSPPPGIYLTAITLEEFTEAGWEIADFENFEGPVNFGRFGEGSVSDLESNGDITFVGDVSWLAGNGRVQFFAEEVRNERTSGRSGALRLRLWATSAPYAGGILQGYPMATKAIGRVKAGFFLPNVSKFAAFRPPREGTYYVTMTIEEYARGWGIVDYVTFPGTSLF
jgi:hypothetical protein